MAAPPPPVSLAEGLPSVFLASTFSRHLIEALDTVLAPLVATIDDLDAYVDPRYAPDDHLVWLGSWLNMAVESQWPAARVRRHLPDLVEALTARGTPRGLEAAVRACTGQEPTVRDGGGVAWSARPNGPLPGRSSSTVVVEVPTPAEARDELRSLVDAVVDDVRPAHVRVEVRWT